MTEIGHLATAFATSLSHSFNGTIFDNPSGLDDPPHTPPAHPMQGPIVPDCHVLRTHMYRDSGQSLAGIAGEVSQMAVINDTTGLPAVSQHLHHATTEIAKAAEQCLGKPVDPNAHLTHDQRVYQDTTKLTESMNKFSNVGARAAQLAIGEADSKGEMNASLSDNGSAAAATNAVHIKAMATRTFQETANDAKDLEFRTQQLSQTFPAASKGTKAFAIDQSRPAVERLETTQRDLSDTTQGAADFALNTGKAAAYNTFHESMKGYTEVAGNGGGINPITTAMAQANAATNGARAAVIGAEKTSNAVETASNFNELQANVDPHLQRVLHWIQMASNYSDSPPQAPDPIDPKALADLAKSIGRENYTITESGTSVNGQCTEEITNALNTGQSALQQAIQLLPHQMSANLCVAVAIGSLSTPAPHTQDQYQNFL